MGERREHQGEAVLIIMLFFVFINHVFSQSTYYWVAIDCGAETSYKDSAGKEWKIDEDFTKSGQNKQVTNNRLAVSEQMDTLRSFGNPNKNCYSIPTPSKVKYLIRAGFFYGNYDGLGKPPAFDLVFDGNKWVTVITSMDKPVLYEMIYATTGDSINICVARTIADQIPFISSLEVIPLEETMYDKMNRNYAWFLSYRCHFGGTGVIGYPDDDYNRIWNPISTPSLTSVDANFTELLNSCPDDPPSSVILHGVQAADASSSILLPFDFPETSRINYLALYFTEVIQISADQKRSFSISIDDQDYGLIVTPRYKNCDEVNVTTNPATGTMNITLSPVDDSTLPPLISAAEVFTVSSVLVQGTNRDDMTGIQTLMKSFSQLQAWTDDPCLPNNTVWEWLQCNTDDPPRVTSLQLSGYGLEGSIPDFHQMQALETINMDHNHLTGRIPDYLGDLPNLRLLNLSYNNLDVEVPSSLNHSKIIYDLTNNKMDAGNSDGNSESEDNKNNPLDGLWSLVGLVIIGYGIWWCCCRKPKTDTIVVQQEHNPVTVIEHVERTTVAVG